MSADAGRAARVAAESTEARRGPLIPSTSSTGHCIATAISRRRPRLQALRLSCVGGSASTTNGASSAAGSDSNAAVQQQATPEAQGSRRPAVAAAALHRSVTNARWHRHPSLAAPAPSGRPAGLCGSEQVCSLPAQEAAEARWPLADAPGVPEWRPCRGGLAAAPGPRCEL